MLLDGLDEGKGGSASRCAACRMVTRCGRPTFTLITAVARPYCSLFLLTRRPVARHVVVQTQQRAAGLDVSVQWRHAHRRISCNHSQLLPTKFILSAPPCSPPAAGGQPTTRHAKGCPPDMALVSAAVSRSPAKKLLACQIRSEVRLGTLTRQGVGVGGGLPVPGCSDLDGQPPGRALVRPLPPLQVLRLPRRHPALDLRQPKRMGSHSTLQYQGPPLPLQVFRLHNGTSAFDLEGRNVSWPGTRAFVPHVHCGVPALPQLLLQQGLTDFCQSRCQTMCIAELL